MGEDGLKLSGRERRRVALVRVSLKDAPILVLDEATANLDAITDCRVVQAIDTFAAGKSAPIISHCPAARGLADSIVTLSGPPVSQAIYRSL